MRSVLRFLTQHHTFRVAAMSATLVVFVAALVYLNIVSATSGAETAARTVLLIVLALVGTVLGEASRLAKRRR